MESWAFFDGNSETITRGWQGTEEQARAYAQRRANEDGQAVEYIRESELHDNEGAGDDWTPPSGVVVEPETEAAIIHERGNGFPDRGDYVAGSDGELYRLVRYVGQIQTGRSPGAGNWCRAIVEIADWDDVSDDWESQASCSVEGDD